MKNIRNTSFILLFAGILLHSCQNDFEEINTDKNHPVNVDPGVVLRNALYDLSSDMHDGYWDFDGYIMQYYEFVTAASGAQYNFTPSTGEGMWYSMYTTLTDVEDVLAKSKELEADNYRAVSLTLKAYIFSILVENFGDVPYSQALKARNGKVFFPAYDDQTTIYKDLIAKLDTANRIISEDEGLVYGGDEYMLGNDMSLWRKFANTLRMRLLMRVSAVAGFNAPAEIAKMVNDPETYPLIASNDENISYKYSGSVPNVNPIYTYRDWEFEGNVPTYEFISRLKGLNDPRIGAFFWPTPATRGTDSLAYEGLPSAITGDSIANYSASNLSVSNGDLLRQTTTPSNYITYSEVQFMLAEAALNGWISGTAEEYYLAGIQASLEEWGREDAYDSYVAQANVVFNNSLERIIEQKYIASFQVIGQQAWAEYRRTGFPALVPGPNNLNNDRIPQRIPYPSLEQALNAESLRAAVAKLGGKDDPNLALFWAKK